MQQHRMSNHNITDSRVLGRKALRLADEDDWEQVLTILNDNEDVYTGFRTKETGDYLIHLAAYAACEKHPSSVDDGEENEHENDNQMLAFQCLKLLLEREKKLVNLGVKGRMLQKDFIARDGGTALHAAIAAASTSSCDIDNANETAWLLLARDAIRMLLEEGQFDPNARIQNTAGIALVGNEDEDEYDLSYAREAIVHGWNPLVMCITWIAIVGSNNQYRYEASNVRSTVASIALSIFLDLVNAGADFNRVLIDNFDETHPRWSPRHYSISLSHQLSSVKVDDIFRQSLKNCDQISVWNIVDDKFSISSSVDITIQEKLLIFALTNDENSLCNYLSIYPPADVLEAINKSIQTCIPLPQMIWGEYGIRQLSIIGVACICYSTKILKQLLMISGVNVDENLLISMSGLIFSDRKAFSLSSNSEQEAKLRGKEKALIEDLLAYVDGNKKQEMVDKLVYLSCFSSWRSSVALSTLIELNGDPTGARLKHNIEHGYSPLHMVAGKMYGNDAKASLNILVAAGADVNAEDNNGHTPLQIAIKFNNYLMIQCLWMQNDGIAKHHSLGVNDLLSVGRASLHRIDIQMLRESIKLLESTYISCSDNIKQEVSNELGNLLLTVTSPKSFIGTCHQKDEVATLIEATIILLKHEMMTNISIQDEIGFSCLHHLLRNRNNGEIIRKELIPIIIDYSKSMNIKVLDIQCSPKIGSFTALHLAYFIGCSFTIDILIQAGANQNIRDNEGRIPSSLCNSNIGNVNIDDTQDNEDEDDWSDVDSVEY